MSASFYDLLKYAKTGIAAPDMTAYDKMRAVAMAGGKVKTLTGVPPLSFTGNGKPLISWSMKGNGQQNGTPTSDAPIQPDFVGKKVGADWTIPIACAGQTVPVYLGQTQTVRRIKKLVLTGKESYAKQSGDTLYSCNLPNSEKAQARDLIMCSHLPFSWIYSTTISIHIYSSLVTIFLNFGTDIMEAQPSGNTVAGLKEYLASQYAAGHPVTIWYVLAEPTTGIVNEPLAKIGNYADELSSEDAGVSIPTAKGSNTLSVDTTVQPSEVSITGKIKTA